MEEIQVYGQSLVRKYFLATVFVRGYFFYYIATKNRATVVFVSVRRLILNRQSIRGFKTSPCYRLSSKWKEKEISPSTCDGKEQGEEN